MTTTTSSVPLSAESRGEAPGRGRLVGRRILVIGGGQADYGTQEDVPGNGRAISVLCGREGATVAVADLNLDSAQRTVDLITAEGAQGYAFQVDATDEDSVRKLIADAQEQLGGLDGLVLNVGIDAGHKIAGTTLEQWETVFALNARTQFLGVKHALPVLENGSSIVMMSSTSAFSASGGVPAMSASKAALNGLCAHVAMENAPRQIRCNIIAPGLIDTPLGRKGGRARSERSSIQIPIGRHGTAWDTAYAVLFLLSNESSYFTGQTLVMDGGRMIR